VDRKKALSWSGDYQDSAVALLDREHDNKAVQFQDEEDDNADANEHPAMFLSPIAKVTPYHAYRHYIILRSSFSSFGRSFGMFGPAPNAANHGTKKSI